MRFMVFKCFVFGSTFGVLFLVSIQVSSAQVVINEFSVRPSDKQDWVELYSPDPIDISNWKIGDESGIFETVPQGTNLGPDLFYVAIQYQRLNNDKDAIFLYDASDVLKDSIAYGYEGEVCSPGQEGSISRIPDGGNTYERVKIATKNSTNDSSELEPCPSPTSEPSPTQTPTSSPKPTSTPTTSPTSKPSKAPTPTVRKEVGLTSTFTPTQPNPTKVEITEENKKEIGVLGIQNVASGDLSPTPMVKDERGVKKFPILAGILVVFGIGLIAAALYPIFIKRRKGYNLSDEAKDAIANVKEDD